MTPAEAAARLGIPADHRAAFEVLVDRLRTPAAEQDELARLRAELGKVDDELRKAGFAYPLGARGVRDLANHAHGVKMWADEKILAAEEKARQAREEADRLRAELTEKTAEVDDKSDVGLAVADSWMRRAEQAEQRLRLARDALLEDGYFDPWQVDLDIAPRITEQLNAMRAENAEQRPNPSDAAIARVRALHTPTLPPEGHQWVSGSHTPKCQGCNDGNPLTAPDWPCDTIRGLDAEETPR